MNIITRLFKNITYYSSKYNGKIRIAIKQCFIQNLIYELKQRRVNNDPEQINVRVYDNWGDLPDALDHLLPGSNHQWGHVKYWARDPILEKIDYHLILNSPLSASWVGDVIIKNYPERIVFAIGEPPGIFHKIFHEGQCKNTIVFTPDEKIAEEFKKERQFIPSPPMLRTWHVKKTIDDLADIYVEKTKKLSWVTSNLNYLPDHKKRMLFLETIRGKLDFDLYGKGFNKIFDKWDGLAPYEYSIAYENTIANFYFTEKLMDCFVADTVPLYYGSPDIFKYFPEKSIIPINPDDPKIIHTIMDIINFDDRSARLDALNEAKHLTMYKYNTFITLANYFQKEKSNKSEIEEIHIKRINPWANKSGSNSIK